MFLLSPSPYIPIVLILLAFSLSLLFVLMFTDPAAYDRTNVVWMIQDSQSENTCQAE